MSVLHLIIVCTIFIEFSFFHALNSIISMVVTSRSSAVFRSFFMTLLSLKGSASTGLTQLSVKKKMLQPRCKSYSLLAPPVSAVQKPHSPEWWPATAAVQEVYYCGLHHLPTQWASQGNKYVPHYSPHHWAFLSPTACWNTHSSFSGSHRPLWYLVFCYFLSNICVSVWIAFSLNLISRQCRMLRCRMQ